MYTRVLALVLGGFLLAAAGPPPPAQIEPYIKDGQFRPGDYGWMKGRFDDATAEEKESYRTIIRWYASCWEQARAARQAEFVAAGFPDVNVESLAMGPEWCAGFGQPNLADVTSFAAFQREAAIAIPVADSYLAAVALAEESARPSGREPTLARRLQARTVGEQTLRRGLFWGSDMPPVAPTLSPVGRAIVQSRLGGAMGAIDVANTQWMKGIVAEHGWPKISEVGEEASGDAWLLVQHGDLDPLFQLQVLRLMEPLVASGEVRKQEFAYLYDRVMLKLAGKQRYGTQVHCSKGVRGPMPLEDEARLDALRAEVGLPSEAEYLKVFSIPCEGLPENDL